jgi:hypothetical protein
MWATSCLNLHKDSEETMYIYIHKHIDTTRFIPCMYKTYVYSYVHACMHACIHVCIDAYTHACTHENMHTHTQPPRIESIECIEHAYMIACMHTDIHASVQIKYMCVELYDMKNCDGEGVHKDSGCPMFFTF